MTDCAETPGASCSRLCALDEWWEADHPPRGAGVGQAPGQFCMNAERKEVESYCGWWGGQRETAYVIIKAWEMAHNMFKTFLQWVREPRQRYKIWFLVCLLIPYRYQCKISKKHPILREQTRVQVSEWINLEWLHSHRMLSPNCAVCFTVLFLFSLSGVEKQAYYHLNCCHLNQHSGLFSLHLELPLCVNTSRVSKLIPTPSPIPWASKVCGQPARAEHRKLPLSGHWSVWSRFSGWEKPFSAVTWGSFM